MSKFDILLSELLLERGIRHYISWDTQQAPHMAICGITGTGKTYLVKLILARLSKHNKKSHITLCDFKGDSDFSFLSGCERYHRFNECKKGFNLFYDKFLERQRSNDSDTFELLVIDEWAGFLNYLDKKEAELYKSKLASLLMLSRSFNFHVLLSQQRLDADSFAKARDNFNVIISLGNQSREVKEMLFAEYKNEIKPDRHRGSGYMLTNGTDFNRIIVPKINNIELVNEWIRRAVER